jgi:hypothetical protein
MASSHNLRPSIRELDKVRFSFNSVVVRDVLTIQAIRCPWHRFEPFAADIRFAAHALAVRALFDSLKRRLHKTKAARVVFELTDGQLALCRILNFIESIGSGFDGDLVQSPKRPLKVGKHRLENSLELLQYNVFHAFVLAGGRLWFTNAHLFP